MVEGVESKAHNIQQLTSFFALLADKTRINILLALAEGERNVTSICEKLNLPQPTVSHHLGLLRSGNVIVNRRAGKQVFYGLTGGISTAELDLLMETQDYKIQIRQK